jgi:HK97 gp10 family phage protein
MARSNSAALQAFRRQLESFDKKMRNKVMRTALRKACYVLAKDIKARAPVDTGALKKSIKVRAGKRKRDTITMIVTETGGHPDAVPQFQEFGTRTEPAQPHFRPAVSAQESNMIALVESEIKKAIEGAGK